MECPRVGSPEERRIKAGRLKRSNITTKDLLNLSFCFVCVRPITEYACQVFHNALPHYLSEDLERQQKHALRTIFPGLSYKEALNASNLPTLKERTFNDHLRTRATSSTNFCHLRTYAVLTSDLSVILMLDFKRTDPETPLSQAML